MVENKINLATRLVSILIDHILLTFVIVVILFPITVTDSTLIFNSNTGLIGLGFLFVYFSKDCFGGRSPAKRILKLKVVDIKTGESASPIKCFIRNIFCIIWPVEVFVTFLDTSRRIGDKVAGTRVVSLA